MAGVCRQWILGYTEYVKLLYNLIKKESPDPLVWTPEVQASFESLKSALA